MSPNRPSLNPVDCRGIVIVSHDASRSGAPLIALNIARELVEVRNIPVVTIRPYI